MITILIDNYDSFTWNVFQYLSQLGADVRVFRNDQITLEECVQLRPRNIVISPGPGHPSQAGISYDVIRHFSGKIPILGVCLGEQAIFEVFGGSVTHAGELIHGKTSPISHDERGLYEGLPQMLEVTRYHSLAGDPNTVPSVLEVTSTTESGVIMGVRHKIFVIEGVQFHPESISSEYGYAMFRNFLKWEGGTWENLSIRLDLVSEIPSFTVPKKIGEGIDLGNISKINSVSNKNLSILEQIKIQRMKDVNQLKILPGKSQIHLERRIALNLAPSVIDFHSRLLLDTSSVSIIAEIKRASPSKGDIDSAADAPSQALVYWKSGASAISVLTEPKWFKGHLEDLMNVRRAFEDTPNRPAILRKDFIVDIYQILEARCHGADSILLIVAILTDDKLLKFLQTSRMLGMEPLVEVANEQEMMRAIRVGSKIIGVNNRDLHTFNVDPNRTTSLSALVPSDCILIALSGISTKSDVSRYVSSGARSVLVGEALMRSANKKALIQSFLGLQSEQIKRDGTRKVKICGITNIDDAQGAAKMGADFIGLIFAESPRKISIDDAQNIVKAVSRTGTGLLEFPLSSTLSQSRNIVDEFLAHNGPLFVGVFSNQTVDEINRIVRACKLDLVQLHGEESPLFARLISVPVIKAISVMENDTAETIISKIRSYEGSVNFILLDTGIKGAKAQGGTGKSFDWTVVTLVQRVFPVILAGGLGLSNIKNALGYNPWCFDVSSGIEQEKGKKDPQKLAEFIRIVKEFI